MADSPAAIAGLQLNDFLLGIEDTLVNSFSHAETVNLIQESIKYKLMTPKNDGGFVACKFFRRITAWQEYSKESPKRELSSKTSNHLDEESILSEKLSNASSVQSVEDSEVEPTLDLLVISSEGFSHFKSMNVKPTYFHTRSVKVPNTKPVNLSSRPQSKVSLNSGDIETGLEIDKKGVAPNTWLEGRNEINTPDSIENDDITKINLIQLKDLVTSSKSRVKAPESRWTQNVYNFDAL